MKDITETLEDAREELKRADHLIFVSLKYTRTVDVIKSIVERLVNSFSFSINALLEYYKQKKKIELPTNPGQKVELLKKLNPDARIHELLDLFLFLRKVIRAEYKKSNEYRKHVTMTVKIDDNTHEINMPTIYDYNEKAREFYNTAETVVLERLE